MVGVAVLVAVNAGVFVEVAVAVAVAVATGVGVGRLARVPGEPISLASFAAVKAPLMPTTLNCEIVPPFRPTELSKVPNGALAGELSKDTLACNTPLAL